MKDWNSDSLLILGHRGASADAPENTLEAFRLAATQGADGIEFDVRRAGDGTPVVIHDESVERTTDGEGVVACMSVAELRELDAGNSNHIPTLNEVLETMGADFLYNIEIKGEGWRDYGLEKAVAERIVAFGLENQAVVSSFNFASLQRAQRALPSTVKLAHIHLFSTIKRQLFYYALGYDAIHPRSALVNEKYMTWAKARGLLVNCWTVDDAAEGQRLAKLGVNAVLTNTPGKLREALS